MKTKWYFGALLSVITLFVVTQQQIDVPNQQILFQFNTAKVSSTQAEFAILNVKQQLQTIGIRNTRVSKSENGVIKISYYSNVEVSSVKSQLAQSQNVTLGYSTLSKDKKEEYPQDKTSKLYNLDVLEISQSKDTGSGFNDKYVIEAKHEYVRSSNPDVQVFSVCIVCSKVNVLFNTTQKLNTSVAIAIDNNSYNFPEVRAGPISQISFA